ncbi:hypothetical protein Ndes2526B_g09255 [Nannochloris sp. 'desiccata']
MAWQHLAPRADANLGAARAEPGEIWTRVHASIRMQNYSSAMRALRTHIMTHPNDCIAYDLRCLCAMHCNDYSLALSDAIQCTTLNPAWARGWARLGAAQLCLGHPTGRCLGVYSRSHTGSKERGNVDWNGVSKESWKYKGR